MLLDMGEFSRDVVVFSAFIADETEYCFGFVRWRLIVARVIDEKHIPMKLFGGLVVFSSLVLRP